MQLLSSFLSSKNAVHFLHAGRCRDVLPTEAAWFEDCADGCGCGSLLGAAREGDVIPWGNDFDMLVLLNSLKWCN